MPLRALICLTSLAFIAAPAMAASNRVFVKSTGMDVGACPITSSCRSFSYAMTQVAASGEVIALDTAGYGTFTISQSVSVFAAPGATAFIAVGSGGTGITVNAGASDLIVLRGLALSGSAGGLGVAFDSGLSLSVEICIVSGFTGIGFAWTAAPTSPIRACALPTAPSATTTSASSWQTAARVPCGRTTTRHRWFDHHQFKLQRQ